MPSPNPLPPPPPNFVGEVKHWSGLDNVHIGTIKTILRLIWGIGLALSPPTFIKLTHSRMSVGYHEWPGVLFIIVWRVLKACSPGRELCCLDRETGHKACTKKPFWYCGCSSVSLGLSWRKSHWHVQESQPNAEKLSPLKSCCLLLRLTCIFTQVVGAVFHVIYCDDKRKNWALNKSWKTCLCRYANQIAFLPLSLTEFIQLAINISTSYMAKNIRSRNGCTSYIYFQTSGIYTSSLRITVPRKVQIAKIWGLMPLNISFMIKLGLKVVIIAKIIYSVKVKMCQFICNAKIHAHIYLN